MAVLLTFLLGIPAIFYRAFVLFLGWEWVVVPSGITTIHLTYLAMFALLFFINIAFCMPSGEVKKMETEDVIAGVFKSLIWNTFGLGILFVLKLTCF